MSKNLIQPAKSFIRDILNILIDYKLSNRCLKGLCSKVIYHNNKYQYWVLQLVKKGAFMAKIDLKDAYCSVKIKNEHQKFLKFDSVGKIAEKSNL